MVHQIATMIPISFILLGIGQNEIRSLNNSCRIIPAFHLIPWSILRLLKYGPQSSAYAINITYSFKVLARNKPTGPRDLLIFFPFGKVACQPD
jgi:hypothetical protein